MAPSFWVPVPPRVKEGGLKTKGVVNQSSLTLSRDCWVIHSPENDRKYICLRIVYCKD